MIFLALVILIIFSGFLAGLGKQKALQISKAFYFVGVETLLGCLLFELFLCYLLKKCCQMGREASFQ